MMPFRRSVALAVLLPLLALTTCGGDDGSEVSKRAYVKRVNKVCADVEREIEALSARNVESREEIAALIDDVISRSMTAIERLQAIDRPGGDAGETAESFVKTLDEEVEQEAVPALEDLRDAVENEDVQAQAEAARRLQNLEGSESDRYARELGATACED